MVTLSACRADRALLCPPRCAQPPHRVDLNEPQKCVLVQLLRSCAALTVVDEYRGLAKFNLRELATQDEAQVRPRHGTP